jgi:hypothetical protein
MKSPACNKYIPAGVRVNHGARVSLIPFLNRSLISRLHSAGGIEYVNVPLGKRDFDSMRPELIDYSEVQGTDQYPFPVGQGGAPGPQFEVKPAVAEFDKTHAGGGLVQDVRIFRGNLEQ